MRVKIAFLLLLSLSYNGCKQASLLLESNVVESLPKEMHFGYSLPDNILLANQGDTLAIRIANLEALARYYYLHHNTESSEENQNNLASVLRLLDAINPQDPSYLMSLGYLFASRGAMDQSLAHYKQAAMIDNNPYAWMSLALYAYFAGDLVTSHQAVEYLNNTAYRALFQQMREGEEQRKEIPLNFHTENLPDDNNMLLLLGYQLNPDGTMHAILLKRLNQALLALQQYPESKIILSGGVERNGKTESSVMAQWLIEQGIDQSRLIQENMARDTVENILFSLKIMENYPSITNITIISSATHIKRATTLLVLGNSIFRQRLPQLEPLTIYNLAWQDLNDDALSTHDEFYAITRDVLRMAGAWGFPRLSR